MEEIKFRAWNKLVNKFTYFGEKEPSIETTEHYNTGMFLKATSNVYISGYEELQQYVGLKDKNGKEIYEGDILSDSDCLTGIVKFKNGGYYLDDDVFSPWLMVISVAGIIDDFNVLGNIYENPEILNIK